MRDFGTSVGWSGWPLRALVATEDVVVGDAEQCGIAAQVPLGEDRRAERGKIVGLERGDHADVERELLGRPAVAQPVGSRSRRRRAPGLDGQLGDFRFHGTHRLAARLLLQAPASGDDGKSC